MMAKFSLSPPWEIYTKEMVELFRYDKDVHVVLDDDENYVLKVYVEKDSDKLSALKEILPDFVRFGRVKLTISVIPANAACPMGVPSPSFVIKDEPIDPYSKAFRGNCILSFVKTISGIFPNNLTYVVFKNRVVQYYDDDIGDVYGQTSTLYQDIAKRVLAQKEGIFFCTDIEKPGDSIGNSFGEWP